jgi:hypothetical protein
VLYVQVLLVVSLTVLVVLFAARSGVIGGGGVPISQLILHKIVFALMAFHTCTILVHEHTLSKKYITSQEKVRSQG